MKQVRLGNKQVLLEELLNPDKITSPLFSKGLPIHITVKGGLENKITVIFSSGLITLVGTVSAGVHLSGTTILPC